MKKQTIDQQNAKKTRKARHLGRKVALGFGAVVTAVVPAVTNIACKQTTNSEVPETNPDITIPYGGKTITVKGLASNDPARAKITGAVNTILTDPAPSLMVTTFKNYVKQAGLLITVESVPEYDTEKNFRIIDEDEFAMRIEFISTETEENVMVALLIATTDMDNIYNAVSQDKRFNNAKQTVRLTFGKAQRSIQG
jgi:hypothetical protein